MLELILTGFDTVKQLSEQKEWIKRLKRDFWDKKRIVFTGASGVGKTLLFDKLTGKAATLNFEPFGVSQTAEKGKISNENLSIKVIVVPGQESSPRFDSLQEAFKQLPDGIIHVVANGFAILRNDATIARIQDLDIKSIAQYRKYMLALELEDLKSTLSELQRTYQKSPKPFWLIVAMNKVDLYHETFEEALRYYHTNANSPFVAELTAFQTKIGSSNFDWTALKTSAWLDNFVWGDEEQVSTLNESERNDIITQFLKTLNNYAQR